VDCGSYSCGSGFKCSRNSNRCLVDASTSPHNPLGRPAKVSQSFGVPWSEDRNKVHTGVDVEGKKGEAVTATSAGKVAKTGWLGCKGDSAGTRKPDQCPGNDWGYYVIVEKPSGSAEAYLHLDKPTLKAGDRIITGEKIGAIYSDHLHYNECRKVSECQRGAVTPAEFRLGNFLAPDFD